jgi:hypothetical protein
MIGNRYYVKSCAEFIDNTDTTRVFGFAREEETKKGMDGAQITGAASSYARKYALGGLFLIDDTKDADSTNKHGKDEPKAKEQEKTANLNEEPDIPEHLGQELAPDEVIIKIKEVASKSGETNGKAWTIFAVISETGDRYGTFDVKVAELAKDICSHDLMAKIQWEETKKGKQIVSLIAHIDCTYIAACQPER